jgi:serine protease
MRVVVAIALSACIGTAFAQSREANGIPTRWAQTPPTDQIIVKWRTEAAPEKSQGMLKSARVQKLASDSSVRLQLKQQITGNTEVLQLERSMNAEELSPVLERLAADPDVEYAVADGHRRAHAVPTDPLFTEQWYWRAAEIAATRAEQAWDVTTGSNTTVVAILDTGVRYAHPDLLPFAQGGKLLPGFDFITNVAIANDGNGRDADAEDPGDWITAAQAQQPPFTNSDCVPPGVQLARSSWHGTRVASLIGAWTNNTEGMAGSGWSTLLLPVRVLGRCGGSDSDIIAAMRWAAGLPVLGVPDNPTPAHIINLSLGAEGACSAAYQSAIDEIHSRGVLIVISAGNEGGPVSAPANCNGVMSVVGLRHAGTKVGFSNLGRLAGIGAPGGNCVNTAPGSTCLFFIQTATNNGTTTPGADTYTSRTDASPSVGTSFAAPMVVGAAALMHAVNSRLGAPQYISLLRETAAPFPTSSTTTTLVCHVPSGAPGDIQVEECICTTATCGAGMLNTSAAVLAAQRPFAIAVAPGVITAGVSVTIDATSSFAANGRSITGYQWSALNITGEAPTIAAATQATTTLQVAGTSQFTLRLVVTDDQGALDTADLSVTAPAPPPPPAPQSRSGGGGDAGLLLAVLLFALGARLTSKRRASVPAR